MVNDFVMVYVITDGSDFVFDGCGFAQACKSLISLREGSYFR